MIVTVTMNPAIDKTVDIDSLERGGATNFLPELNQAQTIWSSRSWRKRN